MKKKNAPPKMAFDPWGKHLFVLSFFFLFRAAFSHAVRALYQDSLFALVLQQKIRFYEHIEVAGSITPAKHPNSQINMLLNAWMGTGIDSGIELTGMRREDSRLDSGVESGMHSCGLWSG